MLLDPNEVQLNIQGGNLLFHLFGEGGLPSCLSAATGGGARRSGFEAVAAGVPLPGGYHQIPHLPINHPQTPPNLLLMILHLLCLTLLIHILGPKLHYVLAKLLDLFDTEAQGLHILCSFFAELHELLDAVREIGSDCVEIPHLRRPLPPRRRQRPPRRATNLSLEALKPFPELPYELVTHAGVLQPHGL